MVVKNIAAYIFLVAAISVFSYAQIGEVAGPVNFNVSVGSYQSLPVTIVDGGNAPIAFNVTYVLTTKIKNVTAPIVTINPMNGTINPHSEVVLNVTTYVPGNDKPGTFWNGQISVVSNSVAQITGSGAIIRAGTLKIFTITAAQPKSNILFVILIVIIAAILIVAFYYFYKKRTKIRKSASKLRAKK